MIKFLKKLKWKILYYGDYNIGHKERQYWFKRALSNIELSKGNVLDAGCGLGDYSIISAQLFPNLQVVGLDISEDNITKSKKKALLANLKNVWFEQGDLLNLPHKEYFDLIFSIDVLEHIHDDETVLMNLWRALKREGFLYIHVPLHVKKYYFNRFRHKFATPDHVIDGYEILDIKSKLSAAGFQLEKEYPTHREIARLAYEIYELFRTERKCRLVLRPFLDFIIWIDRIFPYTKTLPAGLGLILKKKR